MNLRLIGHRILHWEYWPLWAIYYPLFPVWLFFSFKARSFFFFNAANPSMKNGGMAMESKMEIYNKIPSENIPETVLIQKCSVLEDVLQKISEGKIKFPCIAKPDIGMKAFGVEKLNSNQDLENYLSKTPGDFLIQQFIPFVKEVGIFYVRYPNKIKGKITGIVSKEFLKVKGDGKRSILQLIKKDPRSHLQLEKLRERWGKSLDNVLQVNQEVVLVPYGSHTRGAKFIDLTYRNNDKLEEIINSICTRIEGFHYGRLDVLYDSFTDLCEGKNFSVIEVNGAGSEATHIYDPEHSLLFAWKEITKHWYHLCNISMINHKKGYPYLSYKDGRTMLREHDELESQLKLV